MEETMILGMLENIGALDFNGHYRLASPNPKTRQPVHSNAYIDVRAALSDPAIMQEIGDEAMIQVFMTQEASEKEAFAKTDIVVGFGNAGPILSHVIAESLRVVRCAAEIMGEDLQWQKVYAEHKTRNVWCVRGQDGKFGFPEKIPSFARLVKPGMTAVIVDDLLTSGGCLRDAVELLESLGVTVLAAIIVVSRNSELTAADCNLPLLFKLSSVDESLIKVWDEDKCPLCASQEPMRPGIAHNDEFLDANPNYPKLQD